MSLSRRLPALQVPAYRTYLASSFLSNVGNSIQVTAIAYQVFVLTGSSFMVGMLGVVRVVPLLLFSLIGGVVADQSDRRKILLRTQAGMMSIALLLGLLTLSGHVSTGWLFVLVAVNAVARAFDGPSRQSLQVNLVPREVLSNAVSINGVAWRLSDIIGPMVMGSLVAVTVVGIKGFVFCYLINFLSFGLLMLTLWRMKPMPPEGQSADRAKSVREVIAFIKDGFEFIRRTPVVRHAMWIDFWATFFSAADALLPAFGTVIFARGPQGFGFLTSATALGALVGAVLMTLLPPVKKQGRMVIVMIFLYGLFTILFGLSQHFYVAAFFLAMTGMADMISTVLRQTIRQLATPDSVRGRMTATSSLFHISGPQLGDFESGVLAKLTGERASVAIGGSCCLLVALWFTRAKALREHRHDSHLPDEPRT